ncbi:MAG: PD40 domain-containing protein [Cyclobacteriaceae bacterium]|nr:PD40 domain-containing protein [Cyclobacteriaceae bacterium]
MNKLLYPVLLLLAFSHCFGQAKLRKLPATINHPAINVSAPYISLDGNSLIFVSDNSDENQLTLFYTTKKDAVNWKDPVMMPKTVNNRLTFLRGFALSPDGKTMYLSSLKSGGLGGFDILVSQLRGAFWAEPVNLGLPINSIGQEACPSIAPDESALYFMRCEKMDQKSASACKLLVSKKSRLGKWEEPVELPDYINTGNSQSPRILGDGETLIFSSNQLPQNKGGMDLYLTRLEEGTWSKPVPLAFANTAKDDQYVSASSLGRYLLKDQPGPRTSEIVELLFPSDLKPKATVKIEGVVAGLENPSSPYIAVFDQKDQNRVYNGRPEKDGTFTFYLKEGAIYNLSIEPEKDNYTFYSKTYDFTSDQVPMSDKVEAVIKPLTKGTELELGIEFKSTTASLSPSSTQSLRRLTRMVKGNPDKKFVLDVTLQGYVTDSLQSSTDLTEVIIDTVHYTVPKQVPDTVKLDSLLIVINERDSLKQVQTKTDSTIVALDDDTTFMAQIDSIRKIAFKTVMVDSVAIKRTYHNNRTEAQAKSIIDYLIKEGATAQNISFTNKAIPEGVAENRKTKVKVIVNE